jgi:hypothetical protein
MTDGQPAIGWVEKVYKKGNKLLADFSDVPRTVYEAVKRKLYRTVSIELLFNVKRDNGQRFNNVLDAVALLGADHPAVNTLADLDALLAMRTSFSGGHKVAFETLAGNVKKLDNYEEDVMDAKEVQALIDKTTQPLIDANAKLTADLEAAQKANAKFKADSEAAEKKQREDAIKLARKSVTDVLDEAVKSKALTPATREVYERQIGVSDDERVVKIDVEEIKKMFSVKAESGKGAFSRSGEESEEGNPEEELLALVNENMADTGESNFSAAFSRVCAANPKLHRAYLDDNGVK